jgi:energy-coupling factor transporter ATP-binding protein EcfA2
VSAIDMDGVTFRYPGTDKAAVDGVDLSIRSGEVTWLFGALGAGASTLLQILAGLAPRHTGGTLEGTVTVLDDTVDSLVGRRGYVTAEPSTQLSQIAETVSQEVAFAPANLGWPVERIREAVSAALCDLSIQHLATRSPEALSGGELQRVVIASMLVLAPSVWLLDEPASALDPAGRLTAFRLMRRWAEEGGTVVVASEDADALVSVADRIVVLQDGRVVLDGPPRDVLAGEQVWRAAGGSTSIAGLARMAQEFDRDGRLASPYPLDVSEAVHRWSR